MIDNRHTPVSDLGLWARARLKLAELTAKPKLPPPADGQTWRSNLQAACVAIRGASGDSFGYPNHAAQDTYRVVPALEWAVHSGLDENTAALAWCLASEAPRVDKYPQYALAIGEAVVNAARAAKLTVAQRITMEGVKVNGKPAAFAGHYARQRGRWCSSFQPPTERHVIAARCVLEADHPFFNDHAERWIDCRVMDKGMQAGHALSYDALGIVRKWGAEGWEACADHPDLDEYVLLRFKRAIKTHSSSVHIGEWIVEDGRRRWGVSK